MCSVVFKCSSWAGQGVCVCVCVIILLLLLIIIKRSEIFSQDPNIFHYKSHY